YVSFFLTRLPIRSRWGKPGLSFAAKPLSPTSGDAHLPPPFPPDPPDPSSSLSPIQFPPLSTIPSKTSLSAARRSHLSPPTAEVSATQNLFLVIVDITMVQSSPENCPIPTIFVPNQTEIVSQTTVPATGNPSQTLISNSTLPSTANPSDCYKLFSPSHNSPLLTNKALNPKPSTNPPHFPPTLADQLRVKGDKSLKRLAPLLLADNGRPHVIIPDSVFHKGAELHKDFIVCYFNGRPPPFNQIQSVLSHMWEKGRKLEIHNNPLQRSAIVCIPSDYLRQKILEKNIWYVGDSMFHTAQWSSAHSASTPPLSSIQIWAHLTGVPFDLRYQQGLSLVAGLVGEPKETDDFTLNLVSLTLSHVKVEVNLTKPLPRVVEFERQNGEVVEVQVDYPWLPPICSHCKELGHVVRNWLTYTPPKNPPTATESAKKQNGKTPINDSRKQASGGVPKGKHYVPVKKTVSVSSTGTSSIPPTDLPPLLSVSLPSSPSADPAKVRILLQSHQVVTCELILPNCLPIIYTAIYASNLSDERNDLWVEFLNLHTTFGLDSKPWIIGGDFNQILYSSDHSAFNHNKHSTRMFQFRDCLYQLGVFDLRYQGPNHTWSNKRLLSHVAKKLDRCLINDDVVSDSWFQGGSLSANLTPLCWKLKCIKRSLKQLNREFSNIQERVKTTHSLLQLAHVQALTDPSPETFEAEHVLYEKWQLLRQIEECFYRQKSSIGFVKGILIPHSSTWRRLGNGETTSFWVDNWSPFGNLQDFLGASTSRFGIPSTATVASLYDQDHWLLPPARSENQLAIQTSSCGIGSRAFATPTLVLPQRCLNSGFSDHSFYRSPLTSSASYVVTSSLWASISEVGQTVPLICVPI
ncbi:unnamed protein product, partial [Brassica napus]